MEELISSGFVSLTSWRRGHLLELTIAVSIWRLKQRKGNVFTIAIVGKLARKSARISMKGLMSIGKSLIENGGQDMR